MPNMARIWEGMPSKVMLHHYYPPPHHHSFYFKSSADTGGLWVKASSKASLELKTGLGRKGQSCGDDGDGVQGVGRGRG